MRSMLIIAITFLPLLPPGVAVLAQRVEPEIFVTNAPRVVRGKTQATYDMGESLLIGGRKIRMLRLQEKVAVVQKKTDKTPAMTVPDVIQVRNRKYRVEQRLKKLQTTVLKTDQSGSTDELRTAMRDLEVQEGLSEVVPVYIHEGSGLQMIPTGDIVIRLAPGYTVDSLDAIQLLYGSTIKRSLLGTSDQFILTVPHDSTEALFEICLALDSETAIKWAEPEFLSEYVECDFRPNDPLFWAQWHLEDIKAPGAWDTTTGSNQIVVAVLDGGIDIDHEDLASNVFINNDPLNGIDDDGNGFVDDITGWNFWDNNNDPRPTDVNDNHGTAVAGVAVAVGNNGKGVAGSAFNSKLMPLKTGRGMKAGFISYHHISDFSEAIYYAAGKTKDGHGTWRGADIISISVEAPEMNMSWDAIEWATKNGRGGKGCSVFCAAGNNASGWHRIMLTGISSGTHTFRWEYSKDSSLTAGDDAIWLDSVEFPGGEIEEFEDGIPSGWSTGGSSDAKWYSVKEGQNGNHARTGTEGHNSRSVRSGSVEHNGYSWIQVTKKVSAGALVFWYWVSSEAGYDGLRLYYDGRALSNGELFASGITVIDTSVVYPASHPDTIAVGACTDKGYGADYSCFGPELDFVAPSSGGLLSITTTDRSGEDGYDPSDYYSGFGGTSAATPLAAGVGALILSVNPTITAANVRSIMQDTCAKIGHISYDVIQDRNNYYGFGRINAEAAVDVAVSSTMVNPN